MRRIRRSNGTDEEDVDEKDKYWNDTDGDDVITMLLGSQQLFKPLYVVGFCFLHLLTQ